MNFINWHSVRVTIVIVTWNKCNDVINLLNSLLTIVNDSITIIVVDNASTDGSSNSIRNHPLPVILLQNIENLGGTGGFNTGVSYALNNLTQDYIWLLDNDADVQSDTLEKLVAVMEADITIGIAGSCILNPENHMQIVEAGGNVDERTATWKPHLRYEPYSYHTDALPMDVDYVPACSALVRKELFDAIGMLDERYFLHWDDVDFGATAKERGFRVVAVLDSIVFHGTEKGYSDTVLYYDVRNSLLFISKHLSASQRILPMFRVCLRSLLAGRLLAISGEKLLSWYLDQAVKNFIAGQFGPAPLPLSKIKTSIEADTFLSGTLSICTNVVVFAVGSARDIIATVQLIHKLSPCASITLAAPADRIDSYRSYGLISNFISYDLARDGVVGIASIGIKILLCRFDCAVSAGSGFVVPFTFFVRRHVVVTHNGNKIVESKACLMSIWKLPSVFVNGFVPSLPTLVKCWLKSRRVSAQ